jgi:hypothetical protein
LALAVALALTLALTLAVALTLALTGTLALTLALAHAIAITLALALLAGALAGADTARSGLALVVGYQWMWVSTIKRIIIIISVRIKGVSSFEKFSIIGPPVVISIE